MRCHYTTAAARKMQAAQSPGGYAIGRDALSNVFREFWPDMAARLRRRNR